MSYQGLALLRVGSLYGEYYEATDDKGNLLGFTMWMPPGQEMFSTLVSPALIYPSSKPAGCILIIYREEQRRLGFNNFMQMLSSEAEVYFKTKVCRYHWRRRLVYMRTHNIIS